LTVSKLAAPITVLYGQALQRFTLATESEKYESVHLAEFPASVENYVNKMLE
jgi:isoleucyl-tRNA synthetase